MDGWNYKMYVYKFHYRFINCAIPSLLIRFQMLISFDPLSPSFQPNKYFLFSLNTHFLIYSFYIAI